MNSDLYQVKTFAKCNILANAKFQDCIELIASNSEENVVNFAWRNCYQVVVKNGVDGAWIVKGKDENIDYLEREMENNVGKHADGVYCILVRNICEKYAVGDMEYGFNDDCAEAECNDNIQYQEHNGYRLTKFIKTDIMVDWSKSKEGLSKNLSEEEVINMAMLGGYKIVTKNGKNGKWYLKGRDKEFQILKEEIDSKLGSAREGVYCILLEKMPEQKEEKTIVIDAKVDPNLDEICTETTCGSLELCKECPICFDDIDPSKNNVTTECGHMFHASCLMKNITVNGFGCPYCRTAMADEPEEEDSSHQWSDYNSQEDDDSEDDEETERQEEEDYALRGMRWMFQRQEGELLEDDVPTPSISHLTQALIAKGYTMEKLVEMIAATIEGYSSRLENEERVEGYINQVREDIKEVVAAFTPEQALAQAQEQAEQMRLEREAQQRAEEEAEEEYRRILREEQEWDKRQDEKAAYYASLVENCDSDRERYECEDEDQEHLAAVMQMEMENEALKRQKERERYEGEDEDDELYMKQQEYYAAVMQMEMENEALEHQKVMKMFSAKPKAPYFGLTELINTNRLILVD
jgi:hypothetical protein